MKKVDYFRKAWVQRYQNNSEHLPTLPAERAPVVLIDLTQDEEEPAQPVVLQNTQENALVGLVPRGLPTPTPPPAYEEVELDANGNPVNGQLMAPPPPVASSAPVYVVARIPTLLPPVAAQREGQIEAIQPGPPPEASGVHLGDPRLPRIVPMAATLAVDAYFKEVENWIPPHIPTRAEANLMTQGQLYTLYMRMTLDELFWSAMHGFPHHVTDPLIVARILMRLVEGMTISPRTIQDQLQLWNRRFAIHGHEPSVWRPVRDEINLVN